MRQGRLYLTSGDPLGSLWYSFALSSLCMNRQVDQSWPQKGMLMRPSEPTGMGIWIMALGKPFGPEK